MFGQESNSEIFFACSISVHSRIFIIYKPTDAHQWKVFYHTLLFTDVSVASATIIKIITHIFAFFCVTLMMASEATKICWRIVMHDRIFYWCAFVGLLHNLKMSFRTTGATPWTRPLLISRTKRNKDLHLTPERLKNVHWAATHIWSMLNTFQIDVHETVRDNLGRQNVASVEGSWPACNPREGWLATRTVSSEAARQLAVLPPPPC